MVTLLQNSIETICLAADFKIYMVMIKLPCAERNCLLSASGAEYAGPVSVSSDGQTCQYWTNTVLPQYQLNIIANFNAVLQANMTSHTNQCRNPDYDPRGPWCYNSRMEKMTCGIQYCGN